MKYKIKILVSLLLSFAFVGLLGEKISSPTRMIAETKYVFATNQYLSKLHWVSTDEFKNTAIRTVVNAPIVLPVAAQVKKTVTYKGRKMEIYVNSPLSQLSEEKLEFFYQTQLKIEKQKQEQQEK